MTGFRLPPTRHWRSYGTEPLPTAAEALAEPFAAFPSWFLRIECDRCGKVVMHNESTRPDGASGGWPTFWARCATTAAVAVRRRRSC